MLQSPTDVLLGTLQTQFDTCQGKCEVVESKERPDTRSFYQGPAYNLRNALVMSFAARHAATGSVLWKLSH
jgi:hypothetical protein